MDVKGVVLMNQFTIPLPLLIYDTLATRTTLTPKQRSYYDQLSKGYLGEKKLQSIIRENSYQNIIPLFGHIFEVGQTEIQIDCLLITANTIYLLEVKNYTGEYYINNNQIFHLQSHREIYNPLNQIERSTFLFKKLLEELDIKFDIKSYVVFINDEFHCYEVSRRLPFIFPKQIRRFLNKVNGSAPAYLDYAKDISRKLLSRTKLNSKYEQLPEIKPESVNHGIFCPGCDYPISRKGRFKLQCNICKKTYDSNYLLLRTVSEYHLLFPDEKITVENITNWSGNVFSKNYIQRFLKNHLKMISKGRYTFYEFLNKNKHIEILSEKFKY